MSFLDWRRNSGKSLDQCAPLLGAANGKVVSRWERREAVPRPDAMARIWVVTGGLVDANSFYELPELDASAMLARAARLEAEAAALRAKAGAELAA